MARLTAITNTRALYNASASALTDASGNSYTLTASGTPAYENGYEGSTNLAFNFDGTWYGYRTGDLGLIGTDDITVQCRVKISTAPTSGQRFCFFVLTTNDGSGSRRCIHVEYQNNGGTLQLQLRHGGSLPLVTQTLTVGTFYKIALVIDHTNSLVRAYVGATGGGDPTEIYNTTLAAANSGNDVGIQVGANYDGSAIPTASTGTRGDFTVDNLRVGKFARTQAQINSDFADSVDVTVSSSVLAATFSTQAPAITGGAAITPSVLAATFSLPTPDIFLPDVIVNISAPLAATFSLPTATPSGDASVTSSVLSALFSTQAPTVSLLLEVAPSVLAATFSLPASTVSLLTNVAIGAPLSATFSIPAITITIINDITIAASVLSATFSIPSIASSGGIWRRVGRTPPGNDWAPVART